MYEQMIDFLGGIPDLPLKRIPGFSLEKNRLSREEYFDQLDFYPREFGIENERRFIALPETSPEFKISETIPFPGGQRRIIEFASRYQARHPGLGAQLERHINNRTAYCNLWTTDEGGTGRRPLVLCIHGFSMSPPKRAARMFHIRRMISLGLDVALFTHPHHWRRRSSIWRQYFLDPNNLPATLENFGRTIDDLHSTVLLLKSLGYDRIGSVGASLGGYTSALYATAAPPLDFIFMAVPMLNFIEYLRPRQAGFSFKVDRELIEKTERALKIITPVDLPPGFDASKISVVMHRGDRICPSRYTREWVEKWSITNSIQLIGGHWLALESKKRGTAWYGWLAEHGYIEGRK